MSYDKVSDHREMVFDSRRNAAYAAALSRLVTGESIVLDLGAGLGVLGLHAAVAGARKVYMVEPSPVAQLARDIARDNGFGERVEVLQGRIEDIELPEQVDVIVSVFTGNLLFSEDLLPSLFHARDHYLKPGGRLLPDLAELWLAPVMNPHLHQHYVGRWSSPDLDLDFGAARRFAANELIWPEPGADLGRRLAPACCLASVDLCDASDADCLGSASTEVQEAGVCHGLLTWIRMRLEDTWLSTDPAEPRLHWVNVVLPLDPPLPLKAGETLTVDLQRPHGGDWTWKVAGTAGSRRHSTFLSRLDNRARLERLSAQGFKEQESGGSP